LFFLLLVMVACGADLADGDVLVFENGGRIDFEARNAPLDAVLRETGIACGVAFDSNNLPDRRVTARYLGVSLDELLERLDFSFGLVVSARGDAGLLHATDTLPPLRPHAVLAAAMLAPRPAGMPGPETWPEDVRAHIANLRDDAVRWNGMESRWELVYIGAPAVPALEYTLYDEDYQARQFAADALRWISDATNYVPSDRFLQVLVEGMADDEYPWDALSTNYTYTYLQNARTAHAYFGSHPESVEQAEPFLVHALFSDDGQQRFLAAVELAAAGKAVYAPRLAQILVPHLADNRISSDASLAAYALHQLGDAVRPQLEQAALSDDGQLLSIAAFLLALLDDPNARPDDTARYSLTYADLSERPPVSMYDWVAENFPQPLP
jgi:hypothetical protein